MNTIEGLTKLKKDKRFSNGTLAQKISVDRSYLTLLLQGKRGIGINLAKKLTTTFPDLEIRISHGQVNFRFTRLKRIFRKLW